MHRSEFSSAVCSRVWDVIRDDKYSLKKTGRYQEDFLLPEHVIINVMDLKLLGSYMDYCFCVIPRSTRLVKNSGSFADLP